MGNLSWSVDRFIIYYQKFIRVETCNERSQLSTIFGNPSLQSFMKVNTARSTNVAKLWKFANMKHLGFFSECFTELFHSIFGQLFWTFVFSFSSHRSVLHYIISRENLGGIASRCSCELIG